MKGFGECRCVGSLDAQLCTAMTARGKLCCLSDLQRCTARVTGNFFDLHTSLLPAQEFLDKNLSILQTHAEFIGSQKKAKDRAALRYTFKTRSLQNRNSRMHMAELTVNPDTKSLSLHSEATGSDLRPL
jgi:hypothetical protein